LRGKKMENVKRRGNRGKTARVRKGNGAKEEG
jgi:hypothetical protein